MDSFVNIAVVGLGYWGPNLVRNLAGIQNVKIVALCDLDESRAKRIQQLYCKDARLIKDFRKIAQVADLHGVVIATPIETHHELTHFFLTHEKNVLIEKPLAQTVEECQRLIDLAEEKKKILMVGHVFEFNPVVRSIKEYIQNEDFGKLFYIYSQRLNLGRIQKNVNAVSSFAPHDISIVNYWLDSEPTWVSVRGFSYLSSQIEDVAFMTLEYPGGIGVHVHISWLDPRKVRQITLVGSRKMIVYDDLSQDAKMKIYDKGIENLDEFLRSPDSFAEFQFKLRSGNLVIPPMKFSEPLNEECSHFIDCIQNQKTPMTDGNSGLRVVKVLEAAEKSLKENGKTVKIG